MRPLTSSLKPFNIDVATHGDKNPYIVFGTHSLESRLNGDRIYQ